MYRVIDCSWTRLIFATSNPAAAIPGGPCVALYEVFQTYWGSNRAWFGFWETPMAFVLVVSQCFRFFLDCSKVLTPHHVKDIHGTHTMSTFSWIVRRYWPHTMSRTFMEPTPCQLFLGLFEGIDPTPCQGHSWNPHHVNCKDWREKQNDGIWCQDQQTPKNRAAISQGFISGIRKPEIPPTKLRIRHRNSWTAQCSVSIAEILAFCYKSQVLVFNQLGLPVEMFRQFWERFATFSIVILYSFVHRIRNAQYFHDCWLYLI